MTIYEANLDKLAGALAELKRGQWASIHYDLFATLFPPGEPYDMARGACLAFARQHGCHIVNKSQLSEIWFEKDA